MIVALPKRPANDNPEREVWTCYACDCAAFILSCADGVTTIHCASCNVDVTQHIVPTLGQAAGEVHASDQ